MSDTGVGGGQTQPRVDPEPVIPCTPLPPWVSHAPWPAEDGESNDTFTDNGVLRLLNDVQTSLLQPGIATHVHTVQRILSRRGAESAANLAVEFDPNHDRVEVHFIRVWRGGEYVDHAPSSAFQLLRRETQLERLALNGRLTATLLIPDLRIDDRLEFAFTSVNRNPIFQGRYSAWLIFNGFAPSLEARQRLIRPAARQLSFKPFNGPPEPIVETSADVEVSRWVLSRQQRIAGEELLPSWTIRSPCYQISEYSDWSEVARLFASLYRSDDIPAAIATELEQIRRRHSGLPERAVEWLRFVQRELRYFALAIGEGGWIPRPLDVIWAGRFGDCKDATRLYVAGARHLGLDACPALVSTTHGPALGDMLPSPILLNHVIVRLQIAGMTYWLDPTLQCQGGTLERLVQAHFGWALPLLEEQVELVRLPESQPLEHIRCEDSISFGPNPESAATLRREYTFAHWAADQIRNRLQNEGASKWTDQVHKKAQANWPEASVTAPLAIRDDLDDNRLTASVTYTIPACWKREDGSERWAFLLNDPLLYEDLAALASTQRRFPVLLGRPRRAQWHVRLEMPCRWRGKGLGSMLEKPGMRVASTLDIQSRQMIFHKELVIDRWSIDAEHAGDYAQVVARLRQNSTKIYAREVFGRIRPPVASKAVVFAKRWRRLLIIIGVMLLMVLLSKLSTPQ